MALAAAVGTAWIQVPLWALMPGSCWPSVVVQARSKHTTAAPWEKPHHLPVIGPDASRFYAFSALFYFPQSATISTCVMEKLMKNHRRVPTRLRHPLGPGRDNLLWLLAKVTWDVQEQLPYPGSLNNILISPYVHSGWEKA